MLTTTPDRHSIWPCCPTATSRAGPDICLHTLLTRLGLAARATPDCERAAACCRWLRPQSPIIRASSALFTPAGWKGIGKVEKGDIPVSGGGWLPLWRAVNRCCAIWAASVSGCCAAASPGGFPDVSVAAGSSIAEKTEEKLLPHAVACLRLFRLNVKSRTAHASITLAEAWRCH